ncbi:hypothetical protein TWF281_003801 [Arthrobotrys megalospora]
MCYEFVLYTGCGHDRSLLYFRPESRTKECLCHSFARLPPHNGICPECDRAIKISRGIPVPPDTLTPQNRAKCQAWREIVDNEVKDHENKRLLREARENGKDESMVTIGREVHVAARHLKRADAHKQKHQSRPKVGNGPNATAPPYVPQPGETFLDHIIVEIIDDAKSGGEVARLQTALEAGVQGYGWIGPTGAESWLYLSKEWMEKNGDKMDVATGSIGPGHLTPSGFPALPTPVVGNSTFDTASDKKKSPTNGKKAAPTPSKLKFDPTKTFVPSQPLAVQSVPSEIATAAVASPTPISGLLTELPPLAILPLLFEKYEEDGEAVITDGSGTGSSFPTTPAAIEEKENVYALPISTLLGPLSQPPSHSPSQLSSQPSSQPLSQLPSRTPSREPSTGLPSQSSTPAPKVVGPYLGVPQPTMRRNHTSPLPQGVGTTVPRGITPTQRGFTPPMPQRGYTSPVQTGYTPIMPAAQRNFTPPAARLRSQFTPHNRHYQSKPHHRRAHKPNGQHHHNYRGPTSAPNPHFVSPNPLLAGPRPFNADFRQQNPGTTGYANGGNAAGIGAPTRPKA